jgi:hypothetical protein
MFGFLKKKRQPTLMDQFIKSVYGDNPPAKSADVDEAVRLAANELLQGAVSPASLAPLARQLADSPIPYSTHDLAVSVALRIFKDADEHARQGLFTAQLMARLTALQWAKEGKLVPALLGAFEQTLYELYKPSASEQRRS